jgi:hypothetical protein
VGDDRFYAKAAGQPAVIAASAKVLAERWDPEARFEAPDGTCNAESHASAVLGILGTGLDLAAVSDYFRRAEEAALGDAVSDGGLRYALGHAAWELMAAAASAERLVT